MKVLLIILGVTAVILGDLVWGSQAQAQSKNWKTLPLEGNGAFAYIQSSRFSNTYLAVYVTSGEDCNMRVSLMTEMDSNRTDLDSVYVGQIPAKLRIDKGQIWDTDGANTSRGEDDDSLFFDNLTTLNGELFGEMLAGNHVIVQVGTEKTNRFNLRGFTSSINKAVEICEAELNEWGDTEYTGDEWTS
jgi:hypothetical protein